MASTANNPTVNKVRTSVGDTRPNEEDRKAIQPVEVSPGDSVKQWVRHVSSTRGVDRRVDSRQEQVGNRGNIIVAHSPESTDEKMKWEDRSTSPEQMVAERKVDGNPRKKARVIGQENIDKTTETTADGQKTEEPNSSPPAPSPTPSARDQYDENMGRDESMTMEMPSPVEERGHDGSSEDDAQDQEEEPAAAALSQRWDKSVPWPMVNITSPGINDCLMGRGGGTNHHPGNKRFRAMTESKKPEYLASKRLDKPIVAMNIINEWRSLEPPGRFLKQDSATKLWYDVGDQKAREKTSQALREKITYSMVGEEGVRIVEQSTGEKEMDPEDKKGIWTEAEMNLVREAQKELGNKWSEVAKRVPGRSENSVKNWWYNHQTSEKRKRKRQEKARIRSGSRPPAKKYNHALIPSSYQGEQGSKKSPPDNWTGEETSPRTVIDIPGTSSNSGRTGPTRRGMVGGTNNSKSFESSSDEGSTCEFGAIGYKFIRQLEDENGQNLGWYVGIVVDVLRGTDKDRKCLYFANGFIEDLSLADLAEIAQLESKRPF